MLRYFPDAIVMHRSFPLFTINDHEITTHGMLSTALHTLNGYICPHLRTDSPELFDSQTLTAECTDSTVNSGQYRRCGDYIMGRCLHLGGCMFWSECRSPNCLTRYGLRRVQLSTWPKADLVVFKVIRTMLGRPTHGSWQAQVLRGCSDEREREDIRSGMADEA